MNTIVSSPASFRVERSGRAAPDADDFFVGFLRLDLDRETCVCRWFFDDRHGQQAQPSQANLGGAFSRLVAGGVL